MVLWKKESTVSDAPFVDLLADKSKIKGYNEWNCQMRSAAWKNRFLNESIEPGKNNVTSDRYRMEGNMYFKNRSWVEAMELYTQSLCFAQPETKNVSLAHANRAACFFEMKMYDKSLRDIELAEKANYPHMENLMARKVRYQQAMEATEQQQQMEFQPKLSFEPNEQFPFMANVLDIQQNAEFGRYIVAKCDIDVGKTVLVEENFVSVTACNDRIQCNTCLQTMKNFIACSKCTDMMFCDENCQHQNDIHRQFCGANIHRMPGTVKYIAKSVLIAIIAIPTVNELMDMVADVLSKRGIQKPPAANDFLSKYKLFLNLQPDKPEKLDLELIYKVFTALMDISMVKRMFNSEQSQRFLQHLIGLHLLIISNNSYGGLNMDTSTASSITLILSLFNHACAPNVFNSTTGYAEVCITMRPIKKGEQVFTKYLCGDRTTRQRQEILLTQWGFVCKCDKCQPHCSVADRARMKSDPCYRLLESNLQRMYYGMCDFKALTPKCEEFLRKYGHLPWCEEIDVALKIYTKCLLDDFPSF